MIDEICRKKRGSLSCEECDNWVIVKVIPKSKRYPHGYAVQQCRLDGEEGDNKESVR